MKTMTRFHKYVAAGNDFVVFDNWDGSLTLSPEQIIALCDRRFGIGADGVLMLSPEQNTDFRMHYFNADGSRGEMCGNGARSLVKFAVSIHKAGISGTFIADDGRHGYSINNGLVEVEILVDDTLHTWDIPKPSCGFINTGVPHLIVPVENVEAEVLDPLGKAMNDHRAHPHGTNVNIIERSANTIHIRTWERGVNMETLACGTGAAAAAIYGHEVWGLAWPVSLSFKGGDLNLDFRGNRYWLTGPSELVFEGHIALSKLQCN